MISHGYLDLTLQVAQRAQGVLSRHLFAPLVDEVGVVEWAGFNVRGLGSSLDLVVGEWTSNQRSRGFFDLDRRRCDGPKHDARVFYDRVVGLDPGCYAQHREIKRAAPS